MSDHATSRSTSPNAIVATDAPRARRIAPTSVPATWLRQAQASLTDWYRRLRDRDELARLEPHLHADLRHDRVNEEISKWPWQP
jgi:hypothetical protein